MRIRQILNLPTDNEGKRGQKKKTPQKRVYFPVYSGWIQLHWHTARDLSKLTIWWPVKAMNNNK